MYENILVPTDGSKTAAVAVDHALDIAEKYGATVHALYVVDIDAVSIGLGPDQVERIRNGPLDEVPEIKEKVEEATGYVVEAGEERGIPVEDHYRVGKPARAIREFAGDNDIDLIVMGSHGRSGPSRVALGSVAERVLRQTRLPVFVVDDEELAED